MNETLQRIATLCAVCHDQCVSACPVVETTRRLSAYPSRLAMLALELDRGGLVADEFVYRSLEDCIGCGACQEGCVYVDQPNDITPVVRWARQAAAHWATPDVKAWVERVRANGSPYDDTREQLAKMREALPVRQAAQPILLIADAATLHLAPEIVTSTIHLLERLEYPHICLAEQTYLGKELYEYGWVDDFSALASRVVAEANTVKPSKIITVHPESAYLLREVYPREAGVWVDVPVFTLAEAVQPLIERLAHPSIGTVFLVQTPVETYWMGGGACQELFEHWGVKVYGKRLELPFRDMSYPTGEVFDICPDPRVMIQNRILEAVRASGAEMVVTTSAEALTAMRGTLEQIPVVDLASFLMGKTQPSEGMI